MRFFFSSRRRHTRWPRDWSSDVCSSDLKFFSRPNHAPKKPCADTHQAPPLVLAYEFFGLVFWVGGVFWFFVFWFCLFCFLWFISFCFFSFFFFSFSFCFFLLCSL